MSDEFESNWNKVGDILRSYRRNEQILVDYYVDKKSFAEIGRKHGLSRERVRQIIKNYRKGSGKDGQTPLH